MNHKYKVGDKVLVEAVVTQHHNHPSGCYVEIIGSKKNQMSWANHNTIRPYTPRQEFEYGEDYKRPGFGFVKFTYYINPAPNNHNLEAEEE